MRFNGLEILLVIIIIIIVFGPGRIAKIAKELGSSISAFRTGLKDQDAEKPQDGEKTDDSNPQS